MAETPAYLKSKAAKYVLGIHRGPLPLEDVDPEEGTQNVDEPKKTISLERTPTNTTQKIRKHWKRFWCCYCFANVIFLAILLPILFCVVLPAVAQLVVNNSDLVLLSARLMDPTPSSVVMTIKSAIKLPIALPVRVNAFPMSLLVRDMPGNNTYAKVYLPDSVIHGNTTLGEENHLTPLNLPVWRQYVRNVLFQETVPLSLHGRTEQHLGELHSMVTLNKDVPLNGLNSFKGFAIHNSTILFQPHEDGTNLLANATLPNPSPFVLEIGRTVFNVKSGDLVIGNTTIDHLLLERGNQTYPLHGILDIKKMMSNLPEILHEQRHSIRNGYLTLQTVGHSVTYKGQTIHYYEDPLKSLVLTAQVSIGSLLVNTLHGLLENGGEHILANSSGSDGLLSSLKESAKSLNSRGLEDMLNKPEALFVKALSRLA